MENPNGQDWRTLEDQAWKVGASEAFESDIFGTIAEILIQMFKREAKGIGKEMSDLDYLDFIMGDRDGRESLAGAMAKAAAPKVRSRKKGELITEVDMEIARAEAKQKANRTMETIARLAGDEMSKAVSYTHLTLPTKRIV